MGGHGRNAHAGAHLKIGLLGQRDRLVRRHGGVLGAGAKGPAQSSFIDPDTLANTRSVHARAHRVDHAGTVLVRHDAWEWHGPLVAKTTTGFGV